MVHFNIFLTIDFIQYPEFGSFHESIFTKRTQGFMMTPLVEKLVSQTKNEPAQSWGPKQDQHSIQCIYI
jgi:hypothetical protein